MSEFKDRDSAQAFVHTNGIYATYDELVRLSSEGKIMWEALNKAANDLQFTFRASYEVAEDLCIALDSVSEGQKKCKHGVILYGNRCLNCEREANSVEQGLNDE